MRQATSPRSAMRKPISRAIRLDPYSASGGDRRSSRGSQFTQSDDHRAHQHRRQTVGRGRNRGAERARTRSEPQSVSSQRQRADAATARTGRSRPPGGSDLSSSINPWDPWLPEGCAASQPMAGAQPGASANALFPAPRKLSRRSPCSCAPTLRPKAAVETAAAIRRARHRTGSPAVVGSSRRRDRPAASAAAANVALHPRRRNWHSSARSDSSAI